MIISNFFADLKVIELASVLAGPLVGSFFAELGATVVKYENSTTSGDVTRQWKQPHEDSSKVSAYYASANYGKEVKMVDLTAESDRKALLEDVASSDVVISNFQKRVEDKLDLGYEALKKVNPRLILVQLDAYSEDDQRPGYDMVMQAETGFLSMNGTSDGGLAKMPVALIDVMASHQMKEAVLMALIRRLKTDQGSHIRVSLYQSGVSALVNQAANFLNTGVVPKPTGTNHPNISVYGNVFYSADNHKFMLAVASDEQFNKLGKTLRIGDDQLDYFCFNQSRLSHRQEVYDILQAAIVKYEWSVIKSMLVDNNIPYSMIYNVKEVFKSKLASDMINEFYIENKLMKNVKSVAFEFTK